MDASQKASMQPPEPRLADAGFVVNRWRASFDDVTASPWLTVLTVGPVIALIFVLGAGTGCVQDASNCDLGVGSLSFIFVYALGLWFICAVGAFAFAAGPLRVALLGAAWGAVAAGIFHALELAPSWKGYQWVDWSRGLEALRWIAILPALAACAFVVWVGVSRCWRSRKTPIVIPTSPIDPSLPEDFPHAWRANYELPAGHLDPDIEAQGVCLSGGGIRAATFSMGAVQSLVAGGVMAETHFLSTVSGGGYFGAAYQSLRYADSADKTTASLGAFAAGMAEEDHVRRHGKYIFDGLAQGLGALFVVLRNAILSLAIVYACLVVFATLTAYAYEFPWTHWSVQLFPSDPEGRVAFGSWAAIAVGIPLGLALVMWVVSPMFGVRTRANIQTFAAGYACLAIAVAVFVLLIPVLAQWISSIGPVDKPEQTETVDPSDGLKVGVIVVLVATGTTVWNAVAKFRKAAEPLTKGSASKLKSGLSAISFAVRFLLTVVVVLALSALAIVVFLVELRDATFIVRAGERPDLAIVAISALLFGCIFFDQTRMSLHPFYKRRLASAFDIVHKSESDRAVEQPDYRTLSTLSQRGKALANPERPSTKLRLVLCAAAHVSGPTLAPPGRRVVPFVFSSDYIGSPKLGYFETDELERQLAGKAFRADVTLQAAAAISGAAFASSMGRASRPFDKMLALSNARLGAWLPNPRYHKLCAKPDSALYSEDELPRQDHYRNHLPRLRRLGYFAREFFAVYPQNDRFLYVTDGGHYENLGLVELLRRRCTTIYCVDASGDHSLAYTLAEAAALAYEELGVTIEIAGFELAARSATAGNSTNSDLKSLQQRLSARSVIRGSFTYPDGISTKSKGTLIVGKATIGEDLDDAQLLSLKSYATKQREFPHDTTADQWFDVDQFQGYLTLGQAIGRKMC